MISLIPALLTRLERMLARFSVCVLMCVMAIECAVVPPAEEEINLELPTECVKMNDNARKAFNQVS